MTNGKKGVLAVAAVVVLLCLLPRIWFLIQVVLVWALILISAFFGSFHAIDRHVTQRSGCETIPQVVQIEALLGKGEHSISDCDSHHVPSGEADIYQWSTDVYFAGRYELTMWVNVEVDPHTSQVSRLVDLPKFILHEVKWVDLSRGSPHISYVGSAQREFGPADWEKVVEANGDFSVIGIQIKDAPIPHFDELVKWSQLRSRERYGVQ